MYYAVEMCGKEYSLNGTIGRDVQTLKFRHLQLRHFVHLPHHYHSLENSRTFQDLALKFPRLSSTKPIFQDFPGPGNCTQKNPGLSRSVGTLTYFPLCVKDGGHTIQSTIVKNPMLHATFTALPSMEPKLLHTVSFTLREFHAFLMMLWPSPDDSYIRM